MAGAGVDGTGGGRSGVEEGLPGEEWEPGCLSKIDTRKEDAGIDEIWSEGVRKNGTGNGGAQVMKEGSRRNI